HPRLQTAHKRLRLPPRTKLQDSHTRRRRDGTDRPTV
ncbi:MAG: hypothetical protein AVDCRST_MAG37-1252, partial [uncultured Rubrobacteraceae bacterium]